MAINLESSAVELAAFTIVNPEFTNIDSELLPLMTARASTGKDYDTGKDTERDEKLFKFLARNHHTSPFEHLSVTFKVSCPLFVRSEWHRHRTQSYNEASMRYTSDFVGNFSLPQDFRGQGKGNLQVGDGVLDSETNERVRKQIQQFYELSHNLYRDLLEAGVAREQARMVIPTGHMTYFYATANILNWARFCALRCAYDAQKEIRDLAIEVDSKLSQCYPRPWKYLKEYMVDA